MVHTHNEIVAVLIYQGGRMETHESMKRNVCMVPLVEGWQEVMADKRGKTRNGTASSGTILLMTEGCCFKVLECIFEYGTVRPPRRDLVSGWRFIMRACLLPGPCATRVSKRLPQWIWMRIARETKKWTVELKKAFCFFREVAIERVSSSSSSKSVGSQLPHVHEACAIAPQQPNDEV
jgi:hypothetical protein